jgi:hypothetical protein
LPQGRAKKIQIQLLLTDFSFQLLDPLARSCQIRRYRDRRSDDLRPPRWFRRAARGA